MKLVKYAKVKLSKKERELYNIGPSSNIIYKQGENFFLSKLYMIPLTKREVALLTRDIKFLVSFEGTTVRIIEHRKGDLNLSQAKIKANSYISQIDYTNF